jgi:TRAP-type C4-dicarboxylate transport system permease small subunit
LKKCLEWYYKLQTAIIVSFFAVVVAVIFYQVVNRSILKMTVNWPEELARYLIVWIIFVSSIAALRKGAMIGVDVITSHLKGLTRLIFEVFQNLVVIVFAVVVTGNALTIIKMQLETVQLSPALHLNMAVPYLAVPVWGFFSVLEILITTVYKIVSYGKKPPDSV